MLTTMITKKRIIILISIILVGLTIYYCSWKFSNSPIQEENKVLFTQSLLIHSCIKNDDETYKITGKLGDNKIITLFSVKSERKMKVNDTVEISITSNGVTAK